MATSGEVRRSMGAFRRWNETREPLQNSEGKTFKFKKRERIVPVYDYRNHKLDKRYYVTESGIVLSFCNPSNPIVTKQTPDGAYYNTINWKVHRLVWFSFAYDALENGTELPPHFGVVINDTKDLKRIKPTFEVHHLDETPKHNNIGNLKLMEKPFNLLLRNLGSETITDEGKWDIFLKNRPALERVSGGIGTKTTISEKMQDIDTITPEEEAYFSKVASNYMLAQTPLWGILQTIINTLANRFGVEVLAEQINMKIFYGGMVFYFQNNNYNLKLYPYLEPIHITVADETVLVENKEPFRKYL